MQSEETFIGIAEGAWFKIPAGRSIQIEMVEPPVQRYRSWRAFSPIVELGPPPAYVAHWMYFTGSMWAKGERIAPGTTVRCLRADGTIYDWTLS